MKNGKFITIGITGACLIVAVVLALWRFSYLDKPTPNKLLVTASFYPLYYFADRIGDDIANVINVTPAGVEPHDYEPTAREIVNMERGDMLIINGGGLETWGTRISDDIANSSVRVVVAGNGLMNKGSYKGGVFIPDSHVWLDPILAIEQVKKIRDGFIEIDPSNMEIFQNNAEILLNELSDLNERYQVELNSCKSRDMITSHSAFIYLADRYRLNQISIAGQSPDEEPSIQRIAEIIELVKKKNIRYIFFESLLDPRLSEVIADEIGASILPLDPLEGLSENDLMAGKNYFTQMEMNLNNLKIALRCTN